MEGTYTARSILLSPVLERNERGMFISVGTMGRETNDLWSNDKATNPITFIAG